MSIFSDLFNYSFDNPIEGVRYIRMISSILGSLLLLIIWSNTRTLPGADKSDFGYLFTFLALLIWIIIDVDYITDKNFTTDAQRKVLSTANNFFLLVSLPYYRHGFPILRKKFDPKYLSFVVGVIGILVAWAITFFWSIENKNTILSLDKIITTITYGLLFFALARSFIKRKYGYLIVLLSFFIMATLIVTQTVLEESVPFNFGYVLYLCSQIGFIMIILLHASSWREEVIHAKSLVIPKEDLLKNLTTRESEILQHIDKTEGDIADILDISVSTVKTHTNSIKKKLRVKNKKDLYKYIDNQIIKRD